MFKRFFGIARFGNYEFNRRGCMLWESFILSKNGPEIFENLQNYWVLVIFPHPQLKQQQLIRFLFVFCVEVQTK